MTNICGGIFTFGIISLDPKDRLRYRSVSLGFDMCGRLWLRPGVWENLFDIEFCNAKVGDEHRFGQNFVFDGCFAFVSRSLVFA